MNRPAVLLRGASVSHDGRTVLGPLDWQVAPHERWIVLGPNGSGKTSLIKLLSLYRFPASGTVEVLGERPGAVDVREHRRRIGLASSSLRDQFRPAIAAVDIVMTARFAALETWWHTYTEADAQAARDCLERVGAGSLAERSFATLSGGEQQRVQLARTLMGSPELLLLDEPTAGLDLAGREQLVASLELLAADPETPASVLVTHHTDEIPPSFTHALLLRDGAALACGPIEQVLSTQTLSECFSQELVLERRDGRWLSWAANPTRPAREPTRAPAASSERTDRRAEVHLIYDDPQITERSAAAGALRRLAHAFVRHRTDPATLAEIAEWADTAAQRLEAGGEAIARPADYFARRYTDPRPPDGAEVMAFSDRAFSGLANPAAMEVEMRRHGEGVRAVVSFGAAFESAPGRVHGGAVCAVVDDTLGYLMICLGVAAYTARLEIDYRAGVPIDVPVAFEAREVRREGRKSHLALEVRPAEPLDGDSAPLIEATGLFVIVPPEQLADQPNA